MGPHGLTLSSARLREPTLGGTLRLTVWSSQGKQRGRAAVVLFLVGLLVIWVAPTGASERVAGSQELRGPHVVQYGESDLPFTTSSLNVVQGSRETGIGCRFTGELTVTPETPAVAIDEIAHDPDTCRSLVRVGEIPVPTESSATSEKGMTVDQGGDPFSVTAGQDVGSTPDAGTEAAAAAVYPRKVARAYSAWEDPPQIDVAKSENWVNWNPTANCASAGWSTRGYRRNWYAGWHSEFHIFEDGANCERVFSKSDSSYENTIFCNPFAVTNVWFLPNRVRGLPAGVATHNWDAGKSGDCASLLHFEHRLWLENP